MSAYIQQVIEQNKLQLYKIVTYEKYMQRCKVLLSTYNGSRYISEQLDSIVTQKCDCLVSLFIRDDGSTDDTVDIIKTYKDKIDLQLICGENIGINNSYYFLIRNSNKSDYYAFADQDDIWFSNKIASGVEKLKCYINQPALYGSDTTTLVMPENNCIPRKVIHSDKYDNIINNLFRIKYSGCTMIINEEMKERLLYLPLDKMNLYGFFPDFAFMIEAIINGNVIYDPISTMIIGLIQIV
ncbi:hypothetical protein FACS1894184_06060 [Clostridia bacterium]|nr:hypothetical protein FACS1894184_06060 [Clostridia bacterium]